MSARLAGRVKILPIAAMELNPPSSTHQGDRPSLVRRWMIFACCGKYETRMPRTRKAARVVAKGFGAARAAQCSERRLMAEGMREVVEAGRGRAESDAARKRGTGDRCVDGCILTWSVGGDDATAVCWAMRASPMSNGRGAMRWKAGCRRFTHAHKTAFAPKLSGLCV